MSQQIIHFNRPYMTGKELAYITEAKNGNMLAGDGLFTKQCHNWLEKSTGSQLALLTHSCTAALEMSALLLDVMPGDEIIMPSYTFVSTANAFALRGGVPVFIDIHESTLNLDERLIEAAITRRTKAIVPVHYAGVGCEMDEIMRIAKNGCLNVIEDAAQAVMSTYKGRALGSIGDMAAYSFHETKNLISGEGGALLVNRMEFADRAEIIREKGTDRGRFFRGELDKYTWRDIGSSFLPGELIAAFLWAQFEEANFITNERLTIWNFYHKELSGMEKAGLLRRPIIPEHCQHNAHMYYIILPDNVSRQHVLTELKKEGINCVFHYVPLHSSPGGKKYGRVHGSLSITDKMSRQLIRLPLWIGISPEQQLRVIETLERTLR